MDWPAVLHVELRAEFVQEFAHLPHVVMPAEKRETDRCRASRIEPVEMSGRDESRKVGGARQQGKGAEPMGHARAEEAVALPEELFVAQLEGAAARLRERGGVRGLFLTAHTHDDATNRSRANSRCIQRRPWRRG